MIKLQHLVKNILKEEEDKKQVAAMDTAMNDALKALATEFQSNKDEIEQEVEKTDLELKEALGVVGIIGILLALPKATELLVKGIGKIVSVWKKLVKPGEAEGNEEEFAHNIIEFTHKWHKLYIKGIKGMLKLTGIFKKAGIASEAEQERAAELVYYTIVAGLAVYSGVGAVSAFKSALSGVSGASNFSLGALESAMAAIKSSEVTDFLGNLGLKASV